jgi:hypothetical protein
MTGSAVVEVQAGAGVIGCERGRAQHEGDPSSGTKHIPSHRLLLEKAF